MKISYGKQILLILSVLVFFAIALLPLIFNYADALFQNRQSLLSELFSARAMKLLGRSLLIAIATTFFSLLIGVPIAFIISRTNVQLKAFLKVACILPLFIPSYINAIAWIHLLGRQGIINKIIMQLFYLEKPYWTIYGMEGTIFVLSLSYFPCITLLTLSALDNIDYRLEEAGRFSARMLTVVRKISLPIAFPAIASGALFTFAFTMSDYGTPDLLEVNTFPVEVFTQFSAFFDSRSASIVSLPPVIVILCLVLLQGWYSKRKSYWTISNQVRNDRMIDLRKYKNSAFIFCCIIIFLSVILPILTLLIESTSLETYKTAFETAYKQIINSILFSAAGATVIVILGFFLSYISERTRWKARSWIGVAAMISLSIPATVVGISLIGFWNNPIFSNLIYGTVSIVIIGYVSRFMPFGIRTISSGFKQINKSIEESATVLGVSWQRTLWRIIVPLTKSSLYASWILAFVMCMGELGATILIYPSGYETLPIRILTITHYGPDRLVSALCIILIVLAIFPLALYSVLTRKMVSVL
jgi:iron(III) transport system permease protein